MVSRWNRSHIVFVSVAILGYAAISVSAVGEKVTQEAGDSSMEGLMDKRQYFDSLGGMAMGKRQYFDSLGGMAMGKRQYFDSLGGMAMGKRQYFDSLGGMAMGKRQYFDSLGGMAMGKRHFDSLGGLALGKRRAFWLQPGFEDYPEFSNYYKKK